MNIPICNLKTGICRIQGDRKSQQDSYLLECLDDRPMVIASVCDGMGGLTGGEAASCTAAKILADNRAKLDELSQYLYEKESITGDEFMAILNA